MKNSPSFLMRYKWMILLVIFAIILVSLYGYNLYIKQSELVMHGPKNHPLNQQISEIHDGMMKCVRQYNKDNSFPEDTKPDDYDFFSKIGLAVSCPLVSSSIKIEQLQNELNRLYPPSSDSNYSD